MLSIDLNALNRPPSPGSPVANLHIKEAAPSPDQTARTAFLNDSLKRPDLTQLCSLLDHLFGNGEWAFTGSTALMIHARALRAEGLKFEREPGDADAIVDDYALAMAGQQDIRHDSKCKEANLVYAEGKTEVLELARAEGQPKLKIDLINSKRSDFGGQQQAMRIEGIPVLPLETLVVSLENRIDRKEAGPHSEEDLDLAKKLTRHQKENAEADPIDPCAQRLAQRFSSLSPVKKLDFSSDREQPPF